MNAAESQSKKVDRSFLYGVDDVAYAIFSMTPEASHEVTDTRATVRSRAKAHEQIAPPARFDLPELRGTD